MQNEIWREGDTYRVTVTPNSYGITGTYVSNLIREYNYYLQPGDYLHLTMPGDAGRMTFRVVPGPRLNPPRPEHHEGLMMQFRASGTPPDIDEPNIEV